MEKHENPQKILWILTYFILIYFTSTADMNFNYKLVLLVAIVLVSFRLIIWYKKTGFVVAVLSYIGGITGNIATSGFDYLHINSLIAFQVTAIISAIYLYVYVDKNEKRKRELQDLTMIDSLSNLYNRRYYNIMLHQELIKAQKNNTQVGLLVMDIDKFKMINDMFGHEVGDILIRDISSAVKSKLSNNELICRYGGDEFVIVLTHYNEIAYRDIKEKIENAMEDVNHKQIYLQNFNVSVSVGLAIYPDDETDAVELFKKADASMYEAKNIQGNSFVEYKEDTLKKMNG